MKQVQGLVEQKQKGGGPGGCRQVVGPADHACGDIQGEHNKCTEGGGARAGHFSKQEDKQERKGRPGRERDLFLQDPDPAGQGEESHSDQGQMQPADAQDMDDACPLIQLLCLLLQHPLFPCEHCLYNGTVFRGKASVDARGYLFADMIEQAVQAGCLPAGSEDLCVAKGPGYALDMIIHARVEFALVHGPLKRRNFSADPHPGARIDARLPVHDTEHAFPAPGSREGSLCRLLDKNPGQQHLPYSPVPLQLLLRPADSAGQRRCTAPAGLIIRQGHREKHQGDPYSGCHADEDGQEGSAHKKTASPAPESCAENPAGLFFVDGHHTVTSVS